VRSGLLFLASAQRRSAPASTVFAARIPPAAHTFQSDVETVHRLVQAKFFDLESFTDRTDFLANAFTYQPYFNLARPNSHKQIFSLTDRRATPTQLAPSTLLASTRLLGLFPESLCGIRSP
jgi:hypothetical protein